MMSNKFGELVREAKGEDRTIRAYAKQSGVDPAIISKIIAGKYVPKKPKVLMDLTSSKAMPRNGITYKKLIEAAQYEESYKAGLIAGVGATSAALSAIGGLPMVAITTGLSVAGVTASLAGKQKIKSKEDILDKAINDMQRFSTTAQGLIYGRLAQKGIMFTLNPERANNLTDNEFDSRMELFEQEVDDYIIGYLYLDKDGSRDEKIIENVCHGVLNRFFFLKPSPKRKVSIVVNCKEVYDYLLKFKGQISYRGYLSIILLDLEKFSLEREDNLAFYHEREDEMPISIL